MTSKLREPEGAKRSVISLRTRSCTQLNFTVPLPSWSPCHWSQLGWWASPSPPLATWWPAAVWITCALCTTSSPPASRPSGSWTLTQWGPDGTGKLLRDVNARRVDEARCPCFLPGYLSCCRFLSDTEIDHYYLLCTGSKYRHYIYIIL